MPAASLGSIASGSNVFINAMVFVYGLQEQSWQCRDLLDRCAEEDVCGVTTLDVVAEATHKLMLLEAVAKEIITISSAAKLRERLREVTKLSEYWMQAESILSMNIILLSTDEARHRHADVVRSSDGLLTNDSLIVATMREHGLTLLASADHDFDHIYGLTRYSPTDL